MTDVEVSPILIGHAFPTKEILLIRMAEEADFCGCQIAIWLSDNFKVHSHGMGGLLFSIQASYSSSSGWKITTLLTREAANADNNAGDGDTEKACADYDDDYEESDADSSAKCIRDCTPLKARWLVTLVLSEIAEKPNMSNTDVKNVFHYFAKCKDNGQG